jgi:hypothetical protein
MVNLSGGFLGIFIAIQITFSFGQKMDCTGRAEFTVNFRIAARETFIAHINIVFHTGITGFFVRVI